MGCCLSSTDKSSALNQHQHFQRSVDSRTPPPVDEETVKEVLSETPTPKPKLQEPVFQEQIQEEKTTQEPVFEVKLDRVQEQNRVFVQELVFEVVDKWEERTPIFGGGEISEAASEIFSLQSESVSVTTVTRDEDDEVQQRIVVNNSNRMSPRKVQKNPRDGFGPGRVVGKSPTRRTDSSPGRRYGPNGNGVGSTRSPQQGQQPMGGRRVGLRAEPNRRDPGESSGRRSRSPATRVTDNGEGGNRANVGRSPSANRRYPGRNPVGALESSNSSTRRIAEPPKTEEGNESLENPLVSLECFIFL